jgi:hypothetical protein
VRSFITVMACAVVLTGCASQLSKYVRTDSAPVDPAQEQATVAQCRGEVATIPPRGDDPYRVKERDVLNACMARNGYIQAER